MFIISFILDTFWNFLFPPMTSRRHTDLVLALSKQKDIDRLRELCRGRKIPAENRADVWKVQVNWTPIRLSLTNFSILRNISLLLKVCLNVVGKPDALSSWDGLLDLNEQDVIREDCRKQASEFTLSIIDCSQLTLLYSNWKL